MKHKKTAKSVLMAVSVASMIDQFNMQNLCLLRSLGYEVHIACNFRQGNTCNEKRIQNLLRKLADMHVVYHQWDCPRSVHSVARSCKAYQQLLNLMHRHSFAWVHCQSPIGGVLARLAAHSKGIPVIYTAHGFHFYKGAPFKNWLLFYPVEKMLAHWTDVLITVNKEDYCFARQHLKAGKVCHIPGVGISIEKYAGCNTRETISGNERIREKAFCIEFQIPPQAKLLLSVGELNRGKNHRVAIAALAKLGRKDVYYMICGQGKLKEKLLRYADRLGVRSFVRLTGYREDMQWIYQNADIFVFPSKREGMPVSLMEAMAAGLPCVVSDIRGNRELIHCTSKEAGLAPGGVRFSANSSKQLANALRYLLVDESMLVKKGMYNRQIVRGYSQELVQQQMKKIYGLIKMNKKKKILHVLKMNQYSGAENVAVTICRILKDKHQFAYACPDGAIRRWLEKEQICFYPMTKFSLRELKRVLQAYQPDIVHAHDYSASVLCGYLKKDFLLISHLHNNPYWIRSWGVRTWCYWRMQKKFDTVLTVSEAIRNEAVFFKKIKQKCIVIGNPVDTERILRMADAAKTDGLVSEYPDLMFIGRLTKQKNPSRFIRIVSKMKKAGIKVNALMLGDGELADRCRHQIRSLGLGDIVRMAGYCENPYPYMRKAKLVLITSDWEGYGLVAAEALSLHVPVLACAVGGLCTIFQNVPDALCHSEKELFLKTRRLLTSQKCYERYCRKLQKFVHLQEIMEYKNLLEQIYSEEITCCT